MSARIGLGLAIAALGVAFTAALWAWSYFGLRWMVSGTDASISYIFGTFDQIDDLLSAAQALLLGIGLFLLLDGAIHLLPTPSPWSRAGPRLLFAGALVVALLEVVTAALTSVTPTPAMTVPLWLAIGLEAFLVLGTTIAALGLVLGLLAVIRGVVARNLLPSPPVPP